MFITVPVYLVLRPPLWFQTKQELLIHILVLLQTQFMDIMRLQEMPPVFPPQAAPVMQQLGRFAIAVCLADPAVLVAEEEHRLVLIPLIAVGVHVLKIVIHNLAIRKRAALMYIATQIAMEIVMEQEAKLFIAQVTVYVRLVPQRVAEIVAIQIAGQNLAQLHVKHLPVHAVGTGIVAEQ